MFVSGIYCWENLFGNFSCESTAAISTKSPATLLGQDILLQDILCSVNLYYWPCPVNLYCHPLSQSTAGSTAVLPNLLSLCSINIYNCCHAKSTIRYCFPATSSSLLYVSNGRNSSLSSLDASSPSRPFLC